METRTKGILKAVVTLGLCAAIGLLGFEVFHWLTHVYASGARVQTDIIKMSSRVDGSIEDILVREGVMVTKGQPLITLVADDVRLKIETLQTDLALEVAERRRLASERDAFEFELESTLTTKREEIRAMVNEHNYVSSRLTLAQRDLNRVNILFEKRLASEKALAEEEDKTLELKGKASIAHANIEIAKRELEQEESRRKQIDVITEKIKISDITSTRIEKQIALERVALGHREIRSPVNGIIDRVYKHPGEYVEEGEHILILHDPKTSWLEAYVDEDDIRHVRVGQSVLIDFEAYPFTEFRGKVERIGSVTSREMGLAETRSGGFGGTTERVPVQVVFEDPPARLTPGMIANINIRLGSMRLW